MSFTFLLWFLLLPRNSECNISLNYNDETIFKSEFCNVTCSGRVHTMCSKAYQTPQCDHFELYPLRHSTGNKLIEVLVNGHNGVRDRIAKKMRIPNMLELFWDVELANMAENFLRQCELSLIDKCTTTHLVFDERETINIFYKFEHSESFIVQNMYQEPGTFYPYLFVERVIRFWYFEKDVMRYPEDTDVKTKTRRLRGENNFTHLAYPFIYRIGCGMAMYQRTFHIICYYYPFYRTYYNSMYYQTGDPATNCPARFPLRDDIYKSLCTTETSLFSVSKASEVEFYLWNIILMLCLLNVLL